MGWELVDVCGVIDLFISHDSTTVPSEIVNVVRSPQSAFDKQRQVLGPRKLAQFQRTQCMKGTYGDINRASMGQYTIEA